MPTLRGWALSGAGLALLVLWYALGEVELLLTGAALLLAQVVALAYVGRWTPELEVSRRLASSTVHDGDTTTVTLLIDNSSKRSVRRVTLEDDVNRLGVAVFEMARLKGGETATATYRVTCRPRGVYRVGPAKIKVNDPLGLAETSGEAGPADRIVVYPAVEELTGFPMYGYYPGGDPRDFVPDLETNHRREVLVWVEACQRWAAGEPTISEPTFPHGVCQADQSLGLGAYRIEGMDWDEDGEPVGDDSFVGVGS